MMADHRTPEELRAMIAYYRREAERTKSADRIRRAHNRIATLQRQLELARRVRGLSPEVEA